jgi:hypothetical protein
MKTSVSYTFTNGYGETYTEVISLAKVRDMKRAVVNPKFQLARSRPSVCNYPVTMIYRHDATSPSGKLLDGSGPSIIIDRFLRKYRNTSPLSTTELLTAPSLNSY